MSFGSISEQVMCARAKAAQAWKPSRAPVKEDTRTRCFAYKDHVITQVATGMFGVRERQSSTRRLSSSSMPKGPSRAWADTCSAIR